MVLERQIWMESNYRVFKFILVTSFLSTLFTSLFIKFNSIKILVPTSVLAILYVGNFWIKNRGGLRDLPYVKAYLVSLAWALLIGFMPYLNYELPISSIGYIIGAAIFLYIFSLAILFDSRDLSIDKPNQRTVPILIGRSTTILVSLACLYLAVILLLFIDTRLTLPLVLLATAGTYLYIKSRHRADDFFYSFWLDGLIYLPGLFAMTASIIGE